jgi:hypothetical protein
MASLHHILVVVLTAFFIAAQAAPTPQPASDTTQSTNSTSGWSKEAIFTLIGLPLAILSILTVVLVASAKARGWLCKPFKREQPFPPFILGLAPIAQTHISDRLYPTQVQKLEATDSKEI